MMISGKKLSQSVETSIGSIVIHRVTPNDNVKIWNALLENDTIPYPLDYYKAVLKSNCVTMDDRVNSNC